MTTFVPDRDLDYKVARLVAKRVNRITEELVREAKRTATDTKVWVTMEDHNVRPEHRLVHGTEIPMNLRFLLPSPNYDRQHYDVGPTQWLREPRDPEASPGLTANCRCKLHIRQGGIIHDIRTDVRVNGTEVTGKVIVTGPRIAESEFGNGHDNGTRWLGRVLRAIKRRLGL